MIVLNDWQYFFSIILISFFVTTCILVKIGHGKWYFSQNATVIDININLVDI